MSVAALGVVMGSIVDTMRVGDVPNDVVHAFLDRLESGFAHMLWGDALDVLFQLVDAIRAGVPGND